MSEQAPPRDAILAELDRLLAWSEIARSPQLARFLDYIVRNTLDGREQSIKAYAIAVDVFGRGAAFDPQVDPIVRVQARRLRGLLDQYYAGEGQAAQIEVRLPTGRYIPEFVTRQPDPSVADALPPALADEAPKRHSSGVPPSWFALLALTLIIAVVAFLFSNWRPVPEAKPDLGGAQPPSVTILDFQNLAGPGAGSPVAAGLALELVTDMEQFEDVDVRYGGSLASAAGDGPSTDFILTGVVRPDGTVVQYSAILTERRTGAVVWNHTISVSASQARNAEVLDMVSRSLSRQLGSTRGPLHVVARLLVSAGIGLDERASTYLCRIMFDIYRETMTPDDAEQAVTCLDAVGETSQEAMILAMRASLVADYASPAVTLETNATNRFIAANQMIQRAIGIAPTSAFVWEQKGWVETAMGKPEEARRSFGSSLQLNPASADSLAAYARLLAFAGQLDDAERFASEAVRDTPQPPPWYFGVPALVALQGGNVTEAVEDAELYSQADRELGPVLAIMAGQVAGDGAVINRYVPQVLDVASFRSRGVLTRLRERISDNALMERIRAALVSAGIPPKALISSF